MTPSTSASQDSCAGFALRQAKRASTRFSPYGRTAGNCQQEPWQSRPTASIGHHQGAQRLQARSPDVLATLAIHLCESSMMRAHNALHRALQCCCTSNDTALQDAALQDAEQAMTRTIYRLGLAKHLVLAALPPGAKQQLQQLQQHEQHLQQLQLQLVPRTMPADPLSEDEEEEVSSSLRLHLD